MPNVAVETLCHSNLCLTIRKTGLAVCMNVFYETLLLLNIKISSQDFFVNTFVVKDSTNYIVNNINTRFNT